MSTLDTFLSYVRPWAPGVSDPTAYKAIRAAAIEFCERTFLWKWEESLTVTVEGCNAGIAVPAGAQVHDIEVVKFNGRELAPKSTRDLDRLMPDWRGAAYEPSGLPSYYTQIEQNTLRVVPAMAGSLYLCLRLKPAQDATDLPDFLAAEYRETIGWGALARILTIPGQSYTNPELGAFYAGKFADRLDRLSAKGVTGQHGAPKRSRARFY